MKGLFSWGCEQPAPDEWAPATQGGLWGLFERETGTEQAFGWCLPPALALEIISKGGRAEGKQGRKGSRCRLGDSLSFWPCLSSGI